MENPMETMGKYQGFWWNILVYKPLYPLVNKQLDPENQQFLMETHLPTPMTGRVELLIYQRVPSGYD